MFFRTKKSGSRSYLQVVENRWENGRARQRVVGTLGRLDQLQESGQLDALLASGARLAHSALLLSAHAKGRLPVIKTTHIGWDRSLIRQRFRSFGVQRSGVLFPGASTRPFSSLSCSWQHDRLKGGASVLCLVPSGAMR